MILAAKIKKESAIEANMGSDYCLQYQAIYNSMTVKPSINIASIQNKFVIKLKNEGIWNKLVALHLVTPDNEQASTLNWINPSDNTLVKRLSTSFVGDQGFLGNSADFSYMDMDFNPSVDGNGIYTNDEASIGVYMNTEISEDHAFLFGYSNGGSMGDPATGVILRTGEWQGKLNNGANEFISMIHCGRGSGVIAFVRTDSNTIRGFINGYFQAEKTDTETGTALLNDQFHALRNKASGLNPSDNGFGCLFYGGLFTDNEMNVLSGIIHDYAVSVGIEEDWWTDILANFDFEGATAIKNGRWTVSGAVDLNDVSDPISGTQSMLIPTNSDARLWMPLYDLDNTIYFKWKMTDATPSVNADIVYLKGGVTGATTIGYLRIYTTGRLYLQHGGVGSYGATVLQDDTVYNVWIDYVGGTGSDSSLKVYISTTTTKPSTPECSVTGQTLTAVLNNIWFYCTANMDDYLIDDLLITS